MVSQKIRKIKVSRVKSCLKALSKLERGEITFSRNLMAKMRPWNLLMCQALGVDFPPTFEEIAAKTPVEIIKSYRFSKIFLDNL